MTTSFDHHQAAWSARRQVAITAAAAQQQQQQQHPNHPYVESLSSRAPRVAGGRPCKAPTLATPPHHHHTTLYPVWRCEVAFTPGPAPLPLRHSWSAGWGGAAGACRASTPPARSKGCWRRKGLVGSGAGGPPVMDIVWELVGSGSFVQVAARECKE